MSLGQACIAFLVQTAFGSLLSFLLNDREALGPMLAAFADEMSTLAERIGDADGEALLEIFERAKAARDRYVDGLK